MDAIKLVEFMSDIRAFRVANNLTQIDLAEYLGVGKAYISQVENGHCALSKPKFSMILNNDRGWDISMFAESAEFTAKNTQSQSGIPLLPVDAIAGVLSGNDAQIMDYECEYYDVPMFRGAEFLIRVSGDSMQPKYYSGDIVACRRLPIDTFFQWNRVYVIGSEQGVILKRVRQGRDESHIVLVSENTDYAPFELSLSKVHSIALVIGVIRAE